MESNIVNPQELLRIARSRWRATADIVKQTGISRTTLWRIESGRFREFSPDIMGKLVKALLK